MLLTISCVRLGGHWTDVTAARVDDKMIRFTAGGQQERIPLGEIRDIVLTDGSTYDFTQKDVRILDAIARGTAGKIESITKKG